MERSQGTTRTHDMLDRIEQQITELSGEVKVFTDTISLAAFTSIESKYTALHEGLAKPTLKTESLDGRKAQLIAQLKALDDRIQATRALLTPDMRPHKCTHGETVSLVSIVLS